MQSESSVNSFQKAGVIFLLAVPLLFIWFLGNVMENQFYSAELGAVIEKSADLPASQFLKPAGSGQSFLSRVSDLWRLNLLVFFLTLAWMAIIKQMDFAARFRTASVRFKLVGLLIYAVALPLSGLVFMGWKYVVEYREFLYQESFNACHKQLSEIENGFESEKRRLLEQFRSYKKMPQMLADPGQLHKHFLAIEEKREQKWIEVRDIEANVLLTTHEKDAAEKLAIICKAIARLGISKFLGHRLAQLPEPKIQAPEVLIQEFLESPLGGWARVFESPDELHRVSFGGFDLFFFWDVFAEPEAKGAFVIADRDVHDSIKQYLAGLTRQRLTLGQGAMRLVAWSVPQRNFIGEEPAEKEKLASLSVLIRDSRRPHSSEIVWQKQKWLVAGTTGRKLPRIVLFCLYPVSEIDRQIAAIQSDLFYGVLFTLILTVLVGTLFSHTIIMPLSGLMAGVQALRRRDTSHRVPIHQDDEIGRLSETFNATSEILTDVLYARKIQNLLIPETAPAIDGYDTDLVYIPAADLGGDYCDILPAARNRWLLVIGDVTGHGVSSALVTAMAKAIVIEYSKHENLDLKEMFICLNEMLYSQFKRKKCMTFFAAILDPATGILSCINAAHPWPLLLKPGARKTINVNGCPPLGFSAVRRDFPSTQLEITAGETLVMYTDVLIESPDASGNPLGTRGLTEICSRYLDLEPGEMRKNIVAEVSGNGQKELGDDLTLIILRRNSDK